MSKIFVGITAEYDTQGNVKPISLTWSDGRVFEIDRVLDVREGPSLIGGGHGMRYTCRIRNKEVMIFREGIDGKWFIEK